MKKIASIAALFGILFAVAACDVAKNNDAAQQVQDSHKGDAGGGSP